MNPRKKRNSSKVNLTISVIFHAVLISVAFFFAAKTGIIPPRFLPISLIKPPEIKKPEPQKAEQPKPETPKPEELAKTPVPPRPETAAAPPPAAEEPAVAPPVTISSGMDFSDGAKDVLTTSDPNLIYKGLVEYTLRSHWNRPEDMADDAFVAKVEVQIDNAGRLMGYDWLSGSGDARWDGSVKQVLAQTKAFSRPPPKGFPEKFEVKFDVETMKTVPVELSSR